MARGGRCTAAAAAVSRRGVDRMRRRSAGDARRRERDCRSGDGRAVRRRGRGTFRRECRLTRARSPQRPCSVWRCRCRCRRRSDGAVCFAESQWGVPQASGTNPPRVTSPPPPTPQPPNTRGPLAPCPQRKRGGAAVAFSSVFFSPLFRAARDVYMYIYTRTKAPRAASHSRTTFHFSRRSFSLSPAISPISRYAGAIVRSSIRTHSPVPRRVGRISLRPARISSTSYIRRRRTVLQYYTRLTHPKSRRDPAPL